MKLAPMFSYFGSKFRAAGRLPVATGSLVFEPFAGSAGFSLNYADRDVVLWDTDDRIVTIWHYLQNAGAARIASLPLFEKGEKVADKPGLCEEEQLFLGYLVARCATGPRPVANAYGAQTLTRGLLERIGKHSELIGHWTIENKSYLLDTPPAPSKGETMTTFADPPYKGAAGSYYREGVKGMDYPALAKFVLSLPGQVIVTEGPDHDNWLPFGPYQRGVDTHRTGTKTEDFVCVIQDGVVQDIKL